MLDYSDIATAVFCQPNIGPVGLTEEEAMQQCDGIDIYVSTFKPMKNTLSGLEEKTLMKMIVDQASDRVVGVHMVDPMPVKSSRASASHSRPVPARPILTAQSASIQPRPRSLSPCAARRVRPGRNRVIPW